MHKALVVLPADVVVRDAVEAGTLEVCDDVVHEAVGELDAVGGWPWFATLAAVDLDELGDAFDVCVNHERRGLSFQYPLFPWVTGWGPAKTSLCCRV